MAKEDSSGRRNPQVTDELFPHVAKHFLDFIRTVIRIGPRQVVEALVLKKQGCLRKNSVPQIYSMGKVFTGCEDEIFQSQQTGVNVQASSAVTIGKLFFNSYSGKIFKNL